MLDINNIKRIYFIGIGGIGMSALARYFNDKKIRVYGYDKVETPLTKKLVQEGMIIHYDEALDRIPEGIDLVVYTPAIPEEHIELKWFQHNDYPIKKRSEVLGMLSTTAKTIAVAGTHGKTSTSAMIAHILKYAGLKPTAFLGGILVNYESNYLFGGREWIVTEADEYDRSFLQLSLNVLIIMSMDPDHLDIYNDHETMIEAYRQLTEKVQSNGTIIMRTDLRAYFPEDWEAQLAKKNIVLKEFGAGNGDWSYQNILIRNQRYQFDVESQAGRLEEVVINMPGQHNVENATAAIAVAQSIAVDGHLIKAGLKSFDGIKRRFELVYDDAFVLVDDYAHHPEELRNAIDTILKLYGDQSITVIFQPHLYTRTRDFYLGFAEQLSRLENVLLMPIYPARELPIEGINSALILGLMTNENKELVDADSLIDKIKKYKNDVVITLGAADLDKFHQPIINALTNGQKEEK